MSDVLHPCNSAMSSNTVKPCENYSEKFWESILSLFSDLRRQRLGSQCGHLLARCPPAEDRQPRGRDQHAHPPVAVISHWRRTWPRRSEAKPSTRHWNKQPRWPSARWNWKPRSLTELERAFSEQIMCHVYMYCICYNLYSIWMCKLEQKIQRGIFCTCTLATCINRIMRGARNMPTRWTMFEIMHCNFERFKWSFTKFHLTTGVF